MIMVPISAILFVLLSAVEFTLIHVWKTLMCIFIIVYKRAHPSGYSSVFLEYIFILCLYSIRIIEFNYCS
jgi:hypothetical protein